LPFSVVRVLDLQIARAGARRIRKLFVQRRQLSKENQQRPAVADDVMHRDDENRINFT